MDATVMALVVKPLVETFVKSYVTPVLANVFKNVKGENAKKI